MIVPHWLWGVWLGAVGIVFAWFLAMELPAIWNARGTRDTLSEVVWDHSHIPAFAFFMMAGIIVFTTIWLLIHFISKGRIGI